MKQLLARAGGLVLLLLLGACSGGGNNPADSTGGPLELVFVAASPAAGASPLRVTLTANIKGGEAPYFYAWDFSNDGSFDDFRNNIFLKTLSLQHDYVLLGGVDTSYQAVLRVTDSKGAVVTSAPVGITVLAGGALTVADVVLLSNTQNAGGDYIYRTGEPVFFRPQITGGTAPLTYQWDFNNDETIDSTLLNPEYTFTHSQAGARTFLVKLRVQDARGQVALRDILVTVEGPTGSGGGGGGGGGAADFNIILSSNPPASGGTIILNWDASAGNPELPLEPRLDLSVVVDPSQAGSPPFEYYWDFENDGSFDSQVVSPSVPYYDSVRKILVNPFLHLEQSKTYKLRVFVIDSQGRVDQEERTIISNNQENSGGKLLVTGTRGRLNGGVFSSTPPEPFGQPTTGIALSEFRYLVSATGSTGNYDWQLDVDGDGTADWPDVAAEPDGFADLAAGAGSTDVKFGFYDDGTGVMVSDFPALGYFPSVATVRSLNTATAPPTVVETFKVQLPISLVRRDPVAITGGPTLLSRSDIVVAGAAQPAQPSPNGNYIPQRDVVIAGGYTGTTPLRDVQQITQTFNEPTAPDTLELVISSVTSGKLPLNQPRGGSVGCTEGTTFFVVGGKNVVNGILASCENQPLTTNGAWVVGGELARPGPFFPIFQAAGTRVPVAVGTNQPGFYLCGGLQPAGGSTSNVSGSLFFSDLSDADANFAGTQLGFGSPGGSMVTPRYDSCMAFANNRLYVIGGRVANGRSVSTVEAFNLLTNQWENVPSLQDFRSGASCEVVNDGNNDIIYVYGGAYYPGNAIPGSGGAGDRTLVATAECFNPKTGVWSYTVGLPANESTENGGTCVMPGAGSAASLPAMGNQLWYLGGAGVGGAETNRIYEFTYYYTINITP